MAQAFLTPFPVDHTKCGSSNSASFPVLILVTDTRFKSVANGGHVHSSSGFDLRPYADSGLTSALTYELVSYNATTGTLEMWVNVPTLSHTVDTPIYLGYGDASLTTDGSSTATWDSNYLAVYHLKDGTTLSAADSTSNARAGTPMNSPTAIAGQIDGGAGFDGTTQSIALPAITTGLSGSFTFEVWANPTTMLGTNEGMMVSEVNSGYTNYFAFIGIEAAGFWQFSLFDGANNPSVASVVNPTLNAWSHIVGVRDVGSTVLRLYVNGTPLTPATDTAGTPTYGNFTLGRQTNLPSRLFEGGLDESRISSIARSADWVLSSYNSQSSPSTFAVMGTETSFGGGGVNVATNTGVVTFTGLAPTIGISNNINLATGTGVLTFNGLSPKLGFGINTGVGQEIYTGLAPRLDFGIKTALGVVTYTGLAPTVRIGSNVLTGVGQVVFTGLAPTIDVTSNVDILTGVGGVVFTGLAPTVINSTPAVIIGPYTPVETNYSQLTGKVKSRYTPVWNSSHAALKRATSFVLGMAQPLPRTQNIVDGYQLVFDKRFDDTALVITGSIRVPSSAFLVDRTIYTTESNGTIFAQSDHLSDASDTPYPYVDSITFTGPPAPFFRVDVTAKNITQHPSQGALIAGPTDPFFSPYNWDDDGTNKIADSCGAYIKGRFTGTSLGVDVDRSVLITFSAFFITPADFPWYAVSIDGGAFTIYQIPTNDFGTPIKTLNLASGLADATHTFEFIFEARSPNIDVWPTNFCSLRIPKSSPWHVDASRAVMGPSLIQPKTILHFGASSEEGWLALPVGNVPQQRASSNWAQLGPQFYGAECGVIAVAGQGYINSTFGIPGLKDSYAGHTATSSRLDGSGHFSPAPDIILVTMGQNDGVDSDVSLQAAIQLLATELRSAAPTSKIIISIDIYGARPTVVTAAVAAYLAANPSDTNLFLANPGPRTVHAFDTPANVNQGHPTPAGSQIIYPLVESAIWRATGQTTLLYKALIIVAGSSLGFFELDDDGGLLLFHPDATIDDWQLYVTRLSDGHIFKHSVQDGASSLFVSGLYDYREVVLQSDISNYPFTDPRTNFSTGSVIDGYITADGRFVCETSTTPAVGDSEIRLIGVFHKGTTNQVGQWCYLHVPGEVIVNKGKCYQNLRLDSTWMGAVSTCFIDSVRDVDSSLRFAIPKAAGRRFELTLTDTSAFKALAKASMTTEQYRSFALYAGDTERLDDGELAFGSDFEEVTFCYDNAVLAMFHLAVGDFKEARRIAYGIAKTVNSDNGIPFGYSQRIDIQDPAGRFYRSGATAWGAYAMLKVYQTLGASFWTGGYAAWQTAIRTAAINVLSWLTGQIDSLGLVRFGTGNTTDGVFDPSVQLTFHSTEHNVDSWFAFILAHNLFGTSAYKTTADGIKNGLMTYHWDDANTRFHQGTDASGVGDGVGALDSHSWGALFLKATNQNSRAVATLALSSDFLTSNPDPNGIPVKAYAIFSAAENFSDPSESTWLEGTAGVLFAQRRIAALDTVMRHDLIRLQEFDGSWRNFQKQDDILGIQDFRSTLGTVWFQLCFAPDNILWTEVG